MYTHAHPHNTELIISSLIMLLILRLPTDSAIYPVSLSRGRCIMRWCVQGCVLGNLFDTRADRRWKDQKIKTALFFASFNLSSSFPVPPPDVKMSRNSCGLCLIFSPSGFSFRLNPYFDYVKSRIPSYTITGMQKYTFLRWHSTPMTFCSLVSYVWPWNNQMKPRGVKVSSEMHWPQDMDSGDIQVWLFSAHALTHMCVL